MQLWSKESCGNKLCISFLIEASKRVFLYVLFKILCTNFKHQSLDQGENPAYSVLAVNLANVL